MEQLQHFSHVHLLNLVQLQQYHNKRKENSETSEDEKEDTFVVANNYFGKCKMCGEEIYSFHLCYYSCTECDYSLHKFCAQLPLTQQNHPLHPDHDLTLSQIDQFHDDNKNIGRIVSKCFICNITIDNFYNYHCSICKCDMDIICATMSEQSMNHPSHPHKLQRCYSSSMISNCNACGEEHKGSFYHCTTCSWYKIHLDCALLPPKLLIQESTNGDFNHSHFLTLVYSFLYHENRAKFFPSCRICGSSFSAHTWHYECSKCRYYAHFSCATLRREAFMSSILLPAGRGRTYRNFKDSDHPNLIRYPFPDECMDLLKHHFFSKDGISSEWKFDDEETFKRKCHQHPLILFDSLLDNSDVSLHDPMKKVELLCNGCVRPITDVPFYKCSQHKCHFVLHEWCTRLPSEIRDYYDHPDHTLVLFPNMPKDMLGLGLFVCEICRLLCNGFAYGCRQCDYYVDIHCGFIPDVITHDAHPNHLLQRFKAASIANYSRTRCMACSFPIVNAWVFRCSTCDLYLHSLCALSLPRTIRHRYDKHPLILRYHPVETQFSEYFCEICEDELDPELWFYHCNTCDWSIHTACAPLKLQCELAVASLLKDVPIFVYLNLKLGGTYEITRLHQLPVTILQGTDEDGQCIVCNGQLQCHIILKCFRYKFVCHLFCVVKVNDA